MKLLGGVEGRPRPHSVRRLLNLGGDTSVDELLPLVSGYTGSRRSSSERRSSAISLALRCPRWCRRMREAVGCARGPPPGRSSGGGPPSTEGLTPGGRGSTTSRSRRRCGRGGRAGRRAYAEGPQHLHALGLPGARASSVIGRRGRRGGRSRARRVPLAVQRQWRAGISGRSTNDGGIVRRRRVELGRGARRLAGACRAGRALGRGRRCLAPHGWRSPPATTATLASAAWPPPRRAGLPGAA